MPLTPGTKLGQYEVVESVGAGGMGEVYRARDTKLGREVAIKVLPDDLASSHERLVRFEREAQLLASLNHPSIATLHGLESDDGIHFLVMELVPGETLQERLARGPLSSTETVAVVEQIIDALEAAHESGVIHRDLKPGNIKITPEEKVKVLDFGLAKSFDQEAGEVDASHSPTLTRDATRAGVILGTAAYMSPEQARGKPVDKRTDIFSFGAVLFEMLSGRKAFEGEMVSDILASVIKLEPDWSRLPERTPKALVNLTHRCLEKDPRRRLRDIGDARMELDTREAAVAPSSGSKRFVAIGVALGLSAGILGSLLLLRSSSNDVRAPPTRFTVVLPPTQDVGPGSSVVDVALSPDGRTLAFRASNQLFVRRMGEVDAVPLAGTESPSSAGPVFSPEGEWLAYRDRRELRKVLIRGGAPITICPARNFGGADWGENGSIVFTDDDGLWTVSAEGGEPTRIAASEEKRFMFPHLLPGGDWLLLSSTNAGDLRSAETFALSLLTGEKKLLLRGVTGVRYIDTGHLLFVDESRQLVAVPFDAQRIEILGGRVSLVGDIPVSPVTAAAQFAVSKTGVLAYLGSGDSMMNRPAWVERDGSVTPLPLEASYYTDVRLSPEAGSVAIQDVLPGPDLWVYEFGRGSSTRLSQAPTVDETPVWSSDGRFIAYSSSQGGTGRKVLRKAADGSGENEELWVTEDHTHVTDWLADGSGLLLDIARRNTGADIFLLELSNEPKVKALLATSFGERLSRLSPDGHWLAYASDESGRYEIYVQPFPDLDARHTISAGGGTEPVWSRDGRELYYRGPSHLMAVTITASEPFEASAPEALFEDVFRLGQTHTSYDVAPDGRFLMLMRLQTASDDDPFRGLDYFHVVLNWFEEVRERAPTDD